MTYKILGDRVLLQQLPSDKMSGPFHLASRYINEQQIHRVLQLGTRCTAPLKLGDLVYLDQYSVNNRTYVEPGPAGSSIWIIDTDHLSLAVSYEVTPIGYASLQPLPLPHPPVPYHCP